MLLGLLRILRVLLRWLVGGLLRLRLGQTGEGILGLGLWRFGRVGIGTVGTVLLEIGRLIVDSVGVREGEIV